MTRHDIIDLALPDVAEIVALLATEYGTAATARMARALEYGFAAHKVTSIGVRDAGRLVGHIASFHVDLRLRGSTIPAAHLAMGVVEVSRRASGVYAIALISLLRRLREQRVPMFIGFSHRSREYSALPGAAVIDAPERVVGLQHICTDAPVRVVSFDQRTHLTDVQTMYELASSTHNGAVVRDTRYWRANLAWASDDPKWFCVAHRSGLPVAYLRATVGSDGAARLMEASALSGDETSVVLLMRHLSEATGHAYWRIPECTGHALWPALSGLPVRERVVARSMTIGVLDSDAFVRSIASPREQDPMELEQQLKDAAGDRASAWLPMVFGRPRLLALPGSPQQRGSPLGSDFFVWRSDRY